MVARAWGLHPDALLTTSVRTYNAMITQLNREVAQ